ncbi:MAG: tail fiber domain-containing protein [Candidatus Levybacteria bacterium]|nr:tail fiber domain-containing protein [Candidatus Levybacteria bacterium]
MELLSQFSQFLFSQKHPASKLTVKNYLSDIRKFIRWFEREFSRAFSTSFLTWQIIEIYKQRSGMQANSLERSLSSLRKFARFLIETNQLSKDPFRELSEEKKAISKAQDKWQIREFKNFLYTNNSSHLTIKNYIIDIRQFINWLEKVHLPSQSYEVKKENIFEKINPHLLEEYKTRLTEFLQLSPASVNRKLSSLRRYFAFAAKAGIMASIPPVKSIEENLPEAKVSQARVSLQYLTAMTQTLAETSGGLPEQTIKQYSRFPPLRILQKMQRLANLLIETILILPVAKLASELHLLIWTAKGQPLFAKLKGAGKDKKPAFADPFTTVHNLRKEFYAPLRISLSHLPWHKRIWHHARYKRPKWYKRYHTYPIAHYFHFALLMIIMTGIGIAVYRGFLLEPQQGKLALAAPARPLKILSFQGRLTDINDNPITNSKMLRFIIYNNEISSGSAKLWEEVRTVNPNVDGVFSVLLASGDSGGYAALCNNGNPASSPATGSCGMPQSLFRDNSSLWLGITVEWDAELSPRQQLAIVDYATNAEVLQGLRPTTDTALTGNTNVVLALNSSGNLVIPGSSTTTLQASGGSLVLTGQSLTMTTNLGSGGNLILDPEGETDLRKGLVNNGTVNHISTALGAVEVDDLFAVLASSSGQSAVTIDQTGTGPILSASVSGVGKFTIENTGAGIFADDVAINGDDLTTTQAIFNLLNTNTSSINFAGAASTISIGSASGTLVLRNGTVTVNGILNATGGINIIPGKNLTFSGFTSDGGLLYTNSSGVVKQMGVGNVGQCLQSAGSGTPIWGSCGILAEAGNSNWTLSSGGLFPKQASVLDVFIGGTATNSAKFAFINTGSGIPTASISGNLALSVPTDNTPEATLDILNNGGLNIRGSAGGNSGLISRLFISNTGNVGIGTTTPGFGLHVVSSNPGIVARFTDTNGSCDIDPTSAGLICISDASLKQDIEPIGNALGKILALKGIHFKWNNQTDDESHIGFIAQEVESVIPELVKTDPKTGIKSINYIGFVPILVNAIKEQQEQIASLAGKVNQQTEILNNLQASIESTVQNLLNTTVVSPISQADRILTNIVSPLSSDTILVNGKLVIRHSGENEDQIRQLADDVLLDVQGSASIAGTLRAKKIIADEIEGLPQASVSATYITNTTNVYQTATPSGSPTPDPAIASGADDRHSGEEQSSDSRISNVSDAGQAFRPSLQSEASMTSNEIASSSPKASPRNDAFGKLSAGNLPEGASLLSPLIQTEYSNIASVGALLSYVPNLQADFARLDSVEARLATFHQGVMIFGPASMSDVSVANQLAIGGNLIIAENAINVLGADLEIQPLRQGNVSFMSGLVWIDTEGNFTVAGNANFAKDVSVKGKLFASLISPIPDEDLVIRLSAHPRESEDLIRQPTDDSNFVIQNASGSGVFKINQLGDLIASGSGTFNNLIANGLRVVRGVQADTSITETVASSSAGTAIITKNYYERTIFSPFVKEDSLIYITPTSDTAGLTPYIARQTAESPEKGKKGSFTIQIPSSISKDIKINWWIVN